MANKGSTDFAKRSLFRLKSKELITFLSAKKHPQLQFLRASYALCFSVQCIVKLYFCRNLLQLIQEIHAPAHHMHTSIIKYEFNKTVSEIQLFFGVGRFMRVH